MLPASSNPRIGCGRPRREADFQKFVLRTSVRVQVHCWPKHPLLVVLLLSCVVCTAVVRPRNQVGALPYATRSEIHRSRIHRARGLRRSMLCLFMYLHSKNGHPSPSMKLLAPPYLLPSTAQDHYHHAPFGVSEL